jgi:hypothetical protein
MTQLLGHSGNDRVNGARRTARYRPCEPNIVMLCFPSIKFYHSSAVGGQCSPRSAPGSRSMIAPVVVLEIAKLWEWTGHSRPPLLSTMGAWARSRHLWVCGGSFCPWSVVFGFSGGTEPRAKYTSFVGKPSNVDSGDAEVFGQERLGGVADPVGDAEGAEVREMAVVEDEDEVRRLVSQAFELVTVAAKEIPHVDWLEVVRLRVPLRVVDCRRGPALDHECPLGRTGMPVELAHGAGVWGFIETPEIPLEIGNCSTVNSLPKLPSITRPCDFPSSNLKVGSSLPASIGSRMLFMKLESLASARLVPTRPAAVVAPRAAAPARKSPCWKLEMECSSETRNWDDRKGKSNSRMTKHVLEFQDQNSPWPFSHRLLSAARARTFLLLLATFWQGVHWIGWRYTTADSDRRGEDEAKPSSLRRSTRKKPR